jgi:hypothetical protein
VRRSQRVPETAPPERLCRFVPYEWEPAPPHEWRTAWEVAHWDRLGRFHAWREARHAWAASHGNGLGTPLDLLFAERQVKEALTRAIRSGG